MGRRFTNTALAVALALAVPQAAHALGTIEGFYGLTRPPGTSFRSSVSGATNDPHVFSNSLNIAGGDVLLDFGGPLELGAVGDVTWKRNSAKQTALGGLLGFKLDLGAIRLDALGEAGGHRYGNLADNPDVVTKSNTDQWFAYVGLRPGFAFQFGRPGLLLGLWGFVRWDLTSKRVPITVGDATSPNGSVKLGGPSIGATVRLGFGF
jgi:hypothetical protein